MNALLPIIRRDLRLATRAGGGALLGALFFLIVIAIAPFAFGPDLVLLSRVGPAVLWLGALLATLLTLDRLLTADFDDGSLDIITMGRTPLEFVVAAKAAAHWLATGLPLVTIAPLLGLMLNVEPNAMIALALALLVGTPALTFVGLIGAALAVTFRRGALLLPVIVLPLTVPVLIFGVAAATADSLFGPAFTILCALTLASAVIGPFAAAAALRHGLE